jgi:hypothetical protein
MNGLSTSVLTSQERTAGIDGWQPVDTPPVRVGAKRPPKGGRVVPSVCIP